MRELPSGTVTFLFTDVERSTRLLHELGDDYAEVLATHRRVLRDAFSARGGVEVDTQGDAFFIAFAKASDALAAAAQGQAALQAGPIRVRMGLHTGEPVLTDEGYVGIDVHRAARIAAAGHGGQVLVSQSTRDLAGSDRLRDLGLHRLKDLTAAERIYQLGDEDFPQLKSLNATNLPVASNPLVGRERELEELQVLLSNSVRLVTVTGAGGSGKTRLGLQVAAELADEFGGGVFFVPLAGVAQPELVPGVIAERIGVRQTADLRDRRALLVVDNFEHLLDGVSAIATILSAAPNTKVLATSRAPLRLEGEREYPLDPLPGGEAVELLTQRARAVRPDFEPDDAAIEICARLDGLPLALELAASRLRTLSSSALLERLEQRLPLLTSGRRDAPERQRTLRATIEWSYELLPAELRAVFARLSVFAGSFSLEAAEAVADASFDEVDALVEMSLLKAGGDRLLMLETIREFAAELLADSGEDIALQRQHAEYFLTVAVSANLMNESEGEQHHEIAIRERDNLYRALEWALEANEIELGLRIATALENHLVVSGTTAAKRVLAELMERAEDLPGDLRARALRARGGVAFSLDESEAGLRYYEDALAEFQRLGDVRGIGLMHIRFAFELRSQGELAEARARAEEGLRLVRDVGFTKGEAQALTILGGLELAEGNDELGFALWERGLALVEQYGFTWWRIIILYSLGFRLLERGRHDEAETRAREALRLSQAIDDRHHGLPLVAMLAVIAARKGDTRRAGLLWAAVKADEARTPVPGWAADTTPHAAQLDQISDAEFERARDEGSRLTLDEAYARALADGD